MNYPQHPSFAELQNPLVTTIEVLWLTEPRPNIQQNGILADV